MPEPLERIPKPIDKIQTHIHGLDIVLQGGLPRSRITTITGGPGTGKTVLATEFIYKQAEAGVSGVFLTLEESARDLRLNANSMGFDLQAMEDADHLAVLHCPVPHRLIQAGDFNLDGLLATVSALLDRVNAEILVIDAIDVVMRVLGNSDAEQQELNHLLTVLRKRNLTTILTSKAHHQGTSVYPMLEYVSDCVIALSQEMQGQVRSRRLQIIKYRGSGFQSNDYPYAISPLGMLLMPVSDVTFDYKQTTARLSSGNAKLDEIMQGGYRQGTSIIIAGPSGSGKTTLAASFAEAACNRGEQVIYVSFEESASEIIGCMESCGIHLQEHVDAERFQIMVTVPEASGIEAFLAQLLLKIQLERPDHVVIDSISASEHMGSPESIYSLVMRIINACNTQNATCILLDLTTRREENNVLGGLISRVATTIYTGLVDDGRSLERRILIAKMRGSGHSAAYHQLIIGGDGLVIRELPSEQTTVNQDSPHGK